MSGDDPKLASRIGDALSDNGLHAEAEECYTKALELDPDLAHVYNRLGISYRKQGKFDMALNLYRKALTFHPEDENLIYNIARTQWDMENYKPAAEQLARALKINPDFREARILLDAVLNKMGFRVREKGAPPDPVD
jgi:tetratricopeptide (TPR) repeat protein